MINKIRTHIIFKMLAGYILLLLFPCLLFSGINFYLSQKYVAAQQLVLEQKTLSQYCNDIQHIFNDCESTYFQLRQNLNFLRYLGGEYKSIGAQMSAYVSEFYSMLFSIKYHSPYIQSLHIYSYNTELVRYDDYIKYIDEMPPNEDTDKLLYGYWYYDQQRNAFVYRRSIQDSTFRTTLGVLEVLCDSSVLIDKLFPLAELFHGTILIGTDANWYEITEEALVLCTDSPNPNHFVSDQIPSLSMDIYLSNTSPVWKSIQNIPLFVVVASFSFICIILFSGIYFGIITKFTNRILSFSNHIKVTSNTALTPYSDTGHDEFKLLVENYNQMLHDNLQLVNQIKLDQLLQHETAYRVLQLQIDPHFIYNTLESIRMTAEMHDETQISDMLFSLSRIMRYAFTIKEQETLLSSELDLLKQYLQIHKMRLGARFDFQINCPEEFMTIKIPQFTLQPLTENAIKYGYLNFSETLLLQISIYKENALLHIQILDNGSGLEPDKMAMINQRLKALESLDELSSGTGIGLDNINSRMHYLHPETFHMELTKPTQGTGLSVLLTWNPLEENQNRTQ